ncbi:MAG TPA: hypothetical protein VFW15_09430 [Thermoanaerobaculia bacterium]|nr:hypothetical protein [Thermoanaerobaculia bacterium]
MKCPRCGGDMNFHAEKVDYARALADPGVMDPDLGGPLEEFHTCPRCRLTVEVPARD